MGEWISTNGLLTVLIVVVFVAGYQLLKVLDQISKKLENIGIALARMDYRQRHNEDPPW